MFPSKTTNSTKTAYIFKEFTSAYMNKFCFIVCCIRVPLRIKSCLKIHLNLAKFFLKIAIFSSASGASPLEPRCILSHIVKMWIGGGNAFRGKNKCRSTIFIEKSSKDASVWEGGYAPMNPHYSICVDIIILIFPTSPAIYAIFRKKNVAFFYTFLYIFRFLIILLQTFGKLP